MIASRTRRILSCGAAILSGQAAALGLGEIKLDSRIGEPLRAEIPLLVAGARPDPGCFSLAAIPGSDIPVITAGRVELRRGNQGDHLLITGRAPVAEPVFMINVKVACNFDLQREYTLLPLAPETQAAVAVGETAAAMPDPAPKRVRRARPSPPAEMGGESFRNPPDTRQAASEAAIATPPAARKARPPVARPTGQDKLLLGAALDALPPTGAGDPLAPVSALEERMLKMETTLHLVTAQVDKLDAALALNAEARAMRQQLQDMQARQGAAMLPVAEAAPPPAPPVRGDGSHDGWVELVLGILLGGSISATIAHLVSRRQDNSRPFDIPPPHIARPRQA
jgi:hypothetical protein